MLIHNANMHDLLKMICDRLQNIAGPIAVHGGNFRLAVDRQGSVYPQVAEELEATGFSEELTRLTRETVGVFPFVTFGMAVDLMTILEEDRHQTIKLFSMVNDWEKPVRSSARARDAFYRVHPLLLTAYQRRLAQAGYYDQVLLKLGDRRGLISEAKLRSSFEHRVRRNPTFTQDSDGSVYTEEISCPILSHGKASCAGEVAELYLRLQAAGFAALVLFYPKVCGGFIRHSAEIVERVSRSDSEQRPRLIINVALPCSGEQSVEELLRDVDIMTVE